MQRSGRSLCSSSHFAASWHILGELVEGSYRIAIPAAVDHAATSAQWQRRQYLAIPKHAIAKEQTHFERVSQPAASQLPAPQPDPSHARRLAEHERASYIRTRKLPSMSEVAEQLRPREGSGCSSGPSISASAQSPEAADEPLLSWQDIVAALREGQQQPVERAQMLTDTFRCSKPHCSASRTASPTQTTPTSCSVPEHCIHIAALDITSTSKYYRALTYSKCFEKVVQPLHACCTTLARF